MSLRWRLLRLVALSVACGSVTCLAGDPALAAGDSSLEAAIVEDPVAGWEAVPDGTLQSLIEFEEDMLSALAGDDVRVAARGWELGNDRVLVMVVDTGQLLTNGGQEARAGVISGCGSATGNPPDSIEPVAGLQNGFAAVCKGTNPAGESVSATVVMWVRGTMLGTVMGTGPAQGMVEAIAQEQNERLGDGALGGGDGSSGTGMIVIGVAVGVLIIAVVAGAVFGGRRRTRAPVPVAAVGAAPPPMSSPTSTAAGAATIPPGWYPVAGNPHHQVYWDGASVVRRARWTGSEWVDAERVAPAPTSESQWAPTPSAWASAAPSPWAPVSGAVDGDR